MIQLGHQLSAYQGTGHIGNYAPFPRCYVNKAHPLYQNLQGLWFPGFGQGDTVYDIAQVAPDRNLTFSNVNQVFWEFNGWGRWGVRTNNNPNGLHHLSLPAWINQNATYTYALTFEYITTAGSGISSLIQADGGSGRTILYIDDGPGSGPLRTSLPSGAGAGNTTLTTGNTYDAVFVKDGNSYTYYLDGKDDGGTSGSTTSQTSDIRFGAHKSNNSNSANVRFCRIAMWDRPLTADDVRLWYDGGPQWGLWAQQLIPAIYAGEAGPPPTFVAAWAKQSTIGDGYAHV